MIVCTTYGRGIFNYSVKALIRMFDSQGPYSTKRKRWVGEYVKFGMLDMLVVSIARNETNFEMSLQAEKSILFITKKLINGRYVGLICTTQGSV